MIDSKSRFSGLTEHTRAHLYTRLTQESPEHMAVYKIESNSLENYRRIHALFRHICALILEETSSKQEVPEQSEAQEPKKIERNDMHSSDQVKVRDIIIHNRHE